MLRKETIGNIVNRSSKNQKPAKQHTQLQMTLSTQIHTFPGTQIAEQLQRHETVDNSVIL